jgi:hypothetical protein
MKRFLMCVLLVLVGVMTAVPENNPVVQPSVWSGYGVDWLYRSLRIGSFFADSLLEDGWLMVETVVADSITLGGVTRPSWPSGESSDSSWVVAEADTLISDSIYTRALSVDTLYGHSPIQFMDDLIGSVVSLDSLVWTTAVAADTSYNYAAANMTDSVSVTTSTGDYYGISYYPNGSEYANAIAIYAHKVAVDVPMYVKVYETPAAYAGDDPIWNSSMFLVAESDTLTIDTAIWGMRVFNFDNPIYMESGKAYVFVFQDMSYGEYMVRLCHTAGDNPHCFVGGMGGIFLQADDPASWLMTDSCTRYDYLAIGSGKNADPWPVFSRTMDEAYAAISTLRLNYLYADNDTKITLWDDLSVVGSVELADSLTLHGPMILPNGETAIADDTLITATGDSIFVSGGLIWKYMVGSK